MKRTKIKKLLNKKNNRTGSMCKRMVRTRRGKNVSLCLNDGSINNIQIVELKEITLKKRF